MSRKRTQGVLEEDENTTDLNFDSFPFGGSLRGFVSTTTTPVQAYHHHIDA